MKVIQTHHSIRPRVLERFIDHLGVHSVTADAERGGNGRCDGMKERRRDGTKEANMNECE